MLKNLGRGKYYCGLCNLFFNTAKKFATHTTHYHSAGKPEEDLLRKGKRLPGSGWAGKGQR